MFHLNVMLSTTVKSTTYNTIDKKWTCQLETAGRAGSKTIISKHLVQATGIGSGTPYMPSIQNESLFAGLTLHSKQYRNARLLAEQGVKVIWNPRLFTTACMSSVILLFEILGASILNSTDLILQSVAVIGSANTAFDIIKDCHDAGLNTTMVARSPTYVFPYEYVMDPHGIGAYDKMPLEVADRMLNTFPLALDGQFSHGLFAHLASLEP